MRVVGVGVGVGGERWYVGVYVKERKCEVNEWIQEFHLTLYICTEFWQ